MIDGLLEVEDIVHRDLKPGNVLWHNGVWKIADFGIAKFVADSTSLQTLKGSGSPPYAAPEQFRYDSPSAATDVYAIACVIHKIISGNPPFTGDMDAIRQGHLELQSEDLPGVSPRINGLLRSMLRKPQAARPSLQRCRQVIQSEGANSPTSAVSGLAQAGLEVASQEAAKEAQEVMETDKIRLMVEQGDDAVREFLGILNRLLDKITEAASAAHRPYKNAPRVTLGSAALSFEPPANPSSVFLEHSGWTVLAYSAVNLACEIERIIESDEELYAVSSSLVYAKQPDDTDYRWYELSFWAANSSFWRQPFSVSPTDRNFDIALSNIMGHYSTAFGPIPIDAEDEQSFQDRWIGLFTKGALQKLRAPNQMPPPPAFFLS